MTDGARIGELEELERRLDEATGRDGTLDLLVASTFGRAIEGKAAPDYTSSVDACVALIDTVLPDWHWHVGHGPLGIVPYAALSRPATPDDAAHLRVEASAPTVPLALLRAAAKAQITDLKGGARVRS